MPDAPFRRVQYDDIASEPYAGSAQRGSGEPQNGSVITTPGGTASSPLKFTVQ